LKVITAGWPPAAEGRDNQSFRNAARHRADARGLSAWQSCWKCVQNADDVPSRPTNGAVAPMVVKDRKAPLELWRERSPRPALRRGPSSQSFPTVRRSGRGPEFLQAGRHHFRRCDFLLRSAILIASSSLLSFNAPGNLGSKLARLLSGQLRSIGSGRSSRPSDQITQ